MKKSILWQLVGLVSVLILSGCAVRTYTVVKDRVDQDLTAGNRGYIMGKVPEITENPQREKTRTTYVTEIELPVFNKLRNKPKAAAASEVSPAPLEKSETPEQELTQNLEKYKVISGDTLEKISKKFYGTTKKWGKIYEANKDKLKAPNKIYPGQILDIPIENVGK